MNAQQSYKEYKLIEDVEKIYTIQPADIKILRVKAGMDQRALAQAASMSNNTISRLENGLTSLTGLPFDKVMNLLNVLNINDNVYKYLREGEMN